MYKTHKNKRVIKYIRTTGTYERYQVDLVEISVDSNKKINFLTCTYWSFF